eukprot:GHVR01087572.1.p1 GENE.GHVR01087572.1~~GHVR01087572.1.p1  ORF type:complete len:385 (+),score=60.28 GHVR01087572.1:85-1239(+)
MLLRHITNALLKRRSLCNCFRSHVTNTFDSGITSKSFRRKKIFAFLLCYFGYAVLYASRKPFSVVKTMIKEELDLSTVELSYIDTAFLTSYAFGQFFLPGMLERLGTATGLMCCYLGSALALLVFSLSSSTIMLVAAWILNGLMNAPAFPMLVRIVSPWFDSNERGTAMGVWVTSQQLGSLVSTAFAAHVSSVYGWRCALFYPACLVGSAGIAVYVFLPEPPPATLRYTGSARSPTPRLIARCKKLSDDSPSMDDSTTSCGTSKAIEITPHRCTTGSSDTERDTVVSVLHVPYVLNLGGAYFCVKLIRYTLLMWLPFFMIQQLVFDPSTAAFSSLFFDVGGIIGAVSSGYMCVYICIYMCVYIYTYIYIYHIYMCVYIYKCVYI